MVSRYSSSCGWFRWLTLQNMYQVCTPLLDLICTGVLLSMHNGFGISGTEGAHCVDVSPDSASLYVDCNRFVVVSPYEYSFLLGSFFMLFYLLVELGVGGDLFFLLSRMEVDWCVGIAQTLSHDFGDVGE